MLKSKLLCCGFLLILLFINNAFAQDPWSQRANMPTARTAHVVGTINGKIYVIGGGGIAASDKHAEVYVYDPMMETSIENSNLTPVKFHLYQNFPNPFNSTTHISFDVQKNCFVTLKVYDVLGRHVSSLVNRNMNIGNYKVQFNGNGVSSAIYLYKIEMENYSKTEKMF